MVISSLVVEAAKKDVAGVVKNLNAIEGVEVHEVQDFKIVVTLEAENIHASHKTASSFSKIPGVMAVNLVYANFEDDPEVAGDTNAKS